MIFFFFFFFFFLALQQGQGVHKSGIVVLELQMF